MERKYRQSLNAYDYQPEEMRAYLRYNGWHFNKKMCEWAVKQMRKNGKPIRMMSKDDIEKAVKEAEQYAAQDKKMKEDVETRNQADQMVYQSEKTLNEMGDKIPAEDKSKVQAGIDKLKEALKGTDTAAIKTATDELTQAFYAVSEKLYQQANPQGAQGGAQAGPDMGGQQAGGAQDGQYYDADYKVVDDDDQNKK